VAVSQFFIDDFFLVDVLQRILDYQLVFVSCSIDLEVNVPVPIVIDSFRDELLGKVYDGIEKAAFTGS
jgi:hypothetical protein